MSGTFRRGEGGAHMVFTQLECRGQGKGGGRRRVFLRDFINRKHGQSLWLHYERYDTPWRQGQGGRGVAGQLEEGGIAFSRCLST